MTFVRKDKSISRRSFLGYTTVGTGAIVSAMVSWLVGTTVIVIAVAGFLTMPQTQTVNAAPESNPPLDCISCHAKVLNWSGKLREKDMYHYDTGSRK